MLKKVQDVDAAVKRLKDQCSIDASLEAAIKTAFIQQLEEGTAVDYVGRRVPTPRLGG